MKIKISILIITILLFSYSLTLHALGVSYNQEFQVNTYTQSYQNFPSVNSLIDGEFVICWQSDGQDGSHYGIYGQRFDSEGFRLGAEFQVNTYTDDDQWYPSVSSLVDGGFVVCWTSFGQEGSDHGVYGQRFDSHGSRRGDEFQVNTYTYDNQWYQSVSSLVDDGFVVCWASNGQDGNNNGIYGQLFNKDGSRRGAEFQVNTYTQSDQRHPSISSLLDGGFVVCWQSDGQDGSHYGIYGQRFDSEGFRLGAEFQVNTYTDDNQRCPSVSSLINGGFVVCWTSFGQDGSHYGIYGQLFDSDGSRRSAEFQVNTYTYWDQIRPSVSGLLDGGFVVCWRSYGQDGSDYGIYGQLFESDGSRRGAEFKVNTYTLLNQLYPSVSGLPDGGFVVCWQSWQDGSCEGIYGKYYLKEINHQLIPFSLLEPAHDSTVKTISPSFKWNQASTIPINLSWELEYHLYLDKEQDFSNPDIFPAIYDTSFTVDSLTPGTTYFWKVLAKNINGDSLWSSQTNGFFVSHNASAIRESPPEKLASFKLLANYPNPFNPQTTIKYFLPMNKASYDVKIIIYDVLGQLVVILKDEPQTPGVYTVKWNGQNTAGQAMPSGVYICVVQAGQFTAMQKMMLVK